MDQDYKKPEVYTTGQAVFSRAHFAAVHDVSAEPRKTKGPGGGEWTSGAGGSGGPAANPTEPRVSINLGVTPNRGKPATDVEATQDYYNSTRYRGWLADVKSEAARLNVQVQDVVKASGLWQGDIEPSASVWVSGAVTKVEALAKSLGAEYNQESVMVFTPDGDDGIGAMYTLPGIKQADRDAAIQAMDKDATPGGRLVQMRDGGYSLEIADDDGSNFENIQALAQKLGTDLFATPGQVKWINGGSDYERQKRTMKGKPGTTHASKAAGFSGALRHAGDQLQALFGTAKWSRDKAWAEAGIRVHPLPPHHALIAMRGGHMTDTVAQGDPVEVYDDNGQWIGGLVALSGIEQGEMGGPLEGQQVVWVGAPSAGAKHNAGQEVEANLVRKAKVKTVQRLIDKTGGKKPGAKFTAEEVEQAERAIFTRMAEAFEEEERMIYFSALFAAPHDVTQERRVGKGMKGGGEWSTTGIGAGEAAIAKAGAKLGAPSTDAKASAALAKRQAAAKKDGLSGIAATTPPVAWHDEWVKGGTVPQEQFNPLAVPGGQGTWKGNQYERKLAAPSGKEGDEVAANPQGMVKKNDPKNAEALMGIYHVSPERFDKSGQAMIDRWDEPAAQKSREWYYDAADLGEVMAQQTHLTLTQAQIAIAACSPQTQWGPASDIGTKSVNIDDQIQAYKIMDAMGNHGDDEIDVSNELLNKWKSYSASGAPVKGLKGKPLSLESYNGLDKDIPQGTNLLGKHKLKELPTDVLWNYFRPEWKMMYNNAATAIRGIRSGDPDVLGGPKTRSFYNDMRYPETARDSTIDVFMVRILTGHRDLMGEEVSELTANPALYKLMSDATARLADKKGWMPHEMQAALWEYEHIEAEKLAPMTQTGKKGDSTETYKTAIARRQQRINAQRVKEGLDPIVWEKKEGEAQSNHDVPYWRGRFYEDE